MADYHNLKNAAILTPSVNTDLGSNDKRYANIYMTGNVAMSNGVNINSNNAITPRVASITYLGSLTATSTAGGETITITGSGFSNVGGNPAVIIGTTAAPVVTYISSTSITFTTPSLSPGTYTLYVINVDGGTAIFQRGISYSGSPVWSTASGSLGNVSKNTSVSLTVLATSDSTVTYSVTSGSLPNGLSLNSSTGAITGTAPSPASLTTYNFTLTATDGENQTTARAFSITVIIALDSVSYLMVAGGGTGSTSGNIGGGGGGAGGLITGILNITTGTTYTITVGAGGASDNTNGSNTIMSGLGMTTLTAIGGGTSGLYGGAGYVNATNGGSGGGAAWNGSNMATYGNALQPSSASGGFGFRGGIADPGTGQYTTGGGGGGADGPGVDVVLNTGGGGVGGPGKLITITAAFVGTATTNSTTTLNITAVTTGEIQVGTQVTGTGIPAGAYITALGTGTGSTGTYIMNVAATSSGSGVAITSSGRYFAGGGGGTTYTTNYTYFGYGGRGGGGNGGADGRIMAVTPTAGAINTGGGGGGRGYSSAAGGSTLGGSGVVLISFPDSFSVAAATTGSPTLLTSGGLRVYKFTQSGSITF